MINVNENVTRKINILLFIFLVLIILKLNSLLRTSLIRKAIIWLAKRLIIIVQMWRNEHFQSCNYRNNNKILKWLNVYERNDRYEINHILNYGCEIKWSYDSRSYKSNFGNCVEKPEKFRTSIEMKPVNTRCRCITDLLRFVSKIRW